MTIILDTQPSRTLADLRGDIQALGYGTDTADAQNRSLNRAQRRICGLRRWPFLENQDATLTTTPGIPNYSIATAYPGYQQLDAVRIETTTPGDLYDLSWMEPQEFRDYEQEDRDSGRPQYWTVINRELRFYPSPDREYTVRTDGKLLVSDMVEDGDIPIIPAPHQDVLVWRAAVDLAARERDIWSRIYAQQEYESSLAEMISALAIRQRQTSAQVRQSGVWDRYGGNFLARRYG